MVFIEAAFIAGIGYTAYSAWSVSRAAAAAEGVKLAEGATGIEFYKERIERGFPLLINTGIVVIPLFNLGDSREEDFLHSQWRLDDGTVLRNMEATESEIDARTIEVADTEASLQALLSKHGIPRRPFTAIPPIITCSYDLSRRPVWYDVKAGVISTKKQWVTYRAAWVRRPPLAATVIAGMAVLAAGEAIKHSYSSVLPCNCLVCKHSKM